jgi:hypothetical protein
MKSGIKPTTVYLPDELAERIATAAAADRRSASSYIVQLLDRVVGRPIATAPAPAAPPAPGTPGASRSTPSSANAGGQQHSDDRHAGPRRRGQNEHTTRVLDLMRKTL